jgi:hypothetical protein
MHAAWSTPSFKMIFCLTFFCKSPELKTCLAASARPSAGVQVQAQIWVLATPYFSTCTVAGSYPRQANLTQLTWNSGHLNWKFLFWASTTLWHLKHRSLGLWRKLYMPMPGLNFTCFSLLDNAELYSDHLNTRKKSEGKFLVKDQPHFNIIICRELFSRNFLITARSLQIRWGCNNIV